MGSSFDDYRVTGAICLAVAQFFDDGEIITIDEENEKDKTIEIEETEVPRSTQHVYEFREDSFFNSIPDFLRVDRKPTRCSSQVLEAFRNPISMEDIVPSEQNFDPEAEILDLDNPSESHQNLSNVLPSDDTEFNSKRILRPSKRKAVDPEIRRSFAKKTRTAQSVNSGRTRNFCVNGWNEMHKQTFLWMKRLLKRQEGSITSFNVYFINVYDSFKMTLSSARPRPLVVHQSMLHLVVDYMKLVEIAKNWGMEQAIGLSQKLFTVIFGLYLGDPNRMFAANLAWIQTKEFFELMMSMIMSSENIYGFLHMINKIESYFIKKTLQREGTHEKFVSYCVTQMVDFRKVLNSRLILLSNRKFYDVAI